MEYSNGGGSGATGGASVTSKVPSGIRSVLSPWGLVHRYTPV